MRQSRKEYEEVHDLFLDCSEDIAQRFQSEVKNTGDIMQQTNRLVRNVLANMQTDTRELRYRLEDGISYHLWLPELQEVLEASGLVKH